MLKAAIAAAVTFVVAAIATLIGTSDPQQDATPASSTTTTAGTPPNTTAGTTATTAPAPTVAAAPETPAVAPPPTESQAPPFAVSITGVTSEQLYASWREGCPVGPESLRLISASHWGFDGGVHTGQLVVHADHAQAIAGVLQSLYDRRFPIERMQPIDVYGGDDDASMAANNTSGFNCRAVTGGSAWSQHAYGWAIDINPIQNPYVTSGGTVLPPAGRDYVDRSTPSPGKILAGDGVVTAFASIGWGWGGYWSSIKDYQHFSATGR